MKNNLIIISILLFNFAIFSLACVMISANSPVSSKFQGKNWYLTEVRIGSSVIDIDRSNNSNLTYTIMFNSEHFTGIGAYSRYFGSYTANKNHSLSFKRVATTRIASKNEISSINEHEYLAYLERVIHWEIHKNALKLYSTKEDGSQVILVYF